MRGDNARGEDQVENPDLGSGVGFGEINDVMLAER